MLYRILVTRSRKAVVNRADEIVVQDVKRTLHTICQVLANAVVHLSGTGETDHHVSGRVSTICNVIAEDYVNPASFVLCSCEDLTAVKRLARMVPTMSVNVFHDDIVAVYLNYRAITRCIKPLHFDVVQSYPVIKSDEHVIDSVTIATRSPATGPDRA